MTTHQKTWKLAEIIFTSPYVFAAIMLLFATVVITQGIEDRNNHFTEIAHAEELDGCGHPGWAGGISPNCDDTGFIFEETTEYTTYNKKDAQEAENSPYVSSSRVIQAKVTGYNTVEAQTDSTPCISASGNNICGREDVAACPRDIDLGTEIEIDGKKYICLDRLAKKYDARFDISCDKDMDCPFEITGIKNVTILR